MTKRGRLITLEGGEGAGKSTLARGLSAALSLRGEVVTTREPGGSPGADDIRALLVRGDKTRWTPLTETLLFIAAREDHLTHVVRPALARGAWVICDRFTDSTVAYQVAGQGAPRATVDALHAMIGAETPDLTILLDLDPVQGLPRSRGVASGEVRFESMDIDFHRRVRAAFLDLARREPARWLVIDAQKPRESVLETALKAIQDRLS